MIWYASFIILSITDKIKVLIPIETLAGMKFYEYLSTKKEREPPISGLGSPLLLKWIIKLLFFKEVNSYTWVN